MSKTEYFSEGYCPKECIFPEGRGERHDFSKTSVNLVEMVPVKMKDFHTELVYISIPVYSKTLGFSITTAGFTYLGGIREILQDIHLYKTMLSLYYNIVQTLNYI